MKSKIYTTILLLALALFAPGIVFAQTFGTILDDITQLINSVFPILVGITIIIFIWGIIRYMLSAGDEEKRKSAVHLITYGIVGLFILTAVWGIIAIINSTFGINPDAPVPTIRIPDVEELRPGGSGGGLIRPPSTPPPPLIEA